MKVKTDDIGCFLLKLRIVGGQAAVQLMRLQANCVHIRCTGDLLPPSTAATLRQDQCVSHRPIYTGFSVGCGLATRIADARFTFLMKWIEGIDPGLCETLLPVLIVGAVTCSDAADDFCPRRALNQTRSKNISGGKCTRLFPLGQFRSLFVRNRNCSPLHTQETRRIH